LETDKPIFTAPPVSANGIKEDAFVMKNTFSEHGNEMEEIISKKPPFFVRWGTVFFLFFLVLISLVCWFIKYPEIIKTKARLTSINAPKQVVTKTAGKLIKLFAKEGEQTNTGSLLGYLESTASHQEVIKLSADADTLQILINSNDIARIAPYLNNVYLNLGEIQQAYQTFGQSFTSFSNYITNGFYLRKKNLLSKDLAFLQKMHSNLLQQKSLNEQDLALTQKSFDASQSLKDDKVISDLDYRNENSSIKNCRYHKLIQLLSVTKASRTKSKKK
jgi:multidrug efflux pump subunit AcrA (membrane-fusion protein)